MMGTTSSGTSSGTRPSGVSGEEAASRWVRGMFGRIAGRYDLLNHLLSFNLDKRWRARAVERVADVLERPGTRAEQIAGQLFALGRVQSAAEIVDQLDAIDAAAVKRYAARVMQAGSPTIAAVGPVGKLETHAAFARRFGPSSGILPDAAE